MDFSTYFDTLCRKESEGIFSFSPPQNFVHQKSKPLKFENIFFTLNFDLQRQILINSTLLPCLQPFSPPQFSESNRGVSTDGVDTLSPPSNDNQQRSLVRERVSLHDYDEDNSDFTLPDAHLDNFDPALWCSPAVARKLQWEWTRVGEESVQPCPIGATGHARWTCSVKADHKAVWTPEARPDLTHCKSVAMTNLEAQVRKEVSKRGGILFAETLHSI